MSFSQINVKLVSDLEVVLIFEHFYAGAVLDFVGRDLDEAVLLTSLQIVTELYDREVRANHVLGHEEDER